MPDFLRSRGRKNGKEAVENTTESGWGVSAAVGSYGVRAHDASESVSRSAASAEDDLSAAPSESHGLDMAGVGEHVASVLAAADAAAQMIRLEAEQDAKEVGQEAALDANDIRARATEEAQTERAATGRLVDEAEAASQRVRSDADQYAKERRREADVRAAQTVRDAERRAASIADTSGERHRVLLANIAESETRLRDLANSLRGAAASLDNVIGDLEAAELDNDDTGGEGGTGPLEDVLRTG
jgi:hypothetical protein